MRTSKKAFKMLLHPFQHIHQVIFRITDAGDDRITDAGDNRITDDSEY
jgi:hypothetical protein